MRHHETIAQARRIVINLAAGLPARHISFFWEVSELSSSRSPPKLRGDEMQAHLFEDAVRADEASPLTSQQVPLTCSSSSHPQ